MKSAIHSFSHNLLFYRGTEFGTEGTLLAAKISPGEILMGGLKFLLQANLVAWSGPFVGLRTSCLHLEEFSSSFHIFHPTLSPSSYSPTPCNVGPKLMHIVDMILNVIFV